MAYPGRDEDDEDEIQYFTHKVVIPHRLEEIKYFAKDAKTELIIRKFDKNQSVFSDWIEDTPFTSRLCVENDVKLWNANKFIKDP